LDASGFDMLAACCRIGLHLRNSFVSYEPL
jgi:hypothetical protein